MHVITLSLFYSAKQFNNALKLELFELIKPHKNHAYQKLSLNALNI